MDSQCAKLWKEWLAHLPPPSSDEQEAEEIKQALETLVRIVEVLDIPDASFISYSTAINNLSERDLTLSRSLVRLKHMEDELKYYIAALQHEQDLATHWNKVLQPGSSDHSAYGDTTILEKRKDALLKKAKEFHQEVEKLMAGQPLDMTVSITQLIAQKEKNLTMQHDINDKRAKLLAFQGLPPNLDLARHELRVARQKQTELLQLRERLLRKMAEGVK